MSFQYLKNNLQKRIFLRRQNANEKGQRAAAEIISGQKQNV